MIPGHLNLLAITPFWQSLEHRPSRYELTDCFQPGPIILIGWLLTTPSGRTFFLRLRTILNTRKVNFSHN